MLEEENDIDAIDETDADQEMFEHYRIEVEKGQFLLRIDKFLMNRTPNATRTKIQQSAENGNVLVNGKPVKSNYKVKPFDVITVVFPHAPREIELKPQNIPINIVYEDDDIIVINKNPGMVVHPGYGNYSGTLVNALVYHFQNLPVNQSGATQIKIRLSELRMPTLTLKAMCRIKIKKEIRTFPNDIIRLNTISKFLQAYLTFYNPFIKTDVTGTH